MNIRNAALAASCLLAIAGCHGAGSGVLPNAVPGNARQSFAAAAPPTVVQSATGSANSPASLTVTFSTQPAAGDVLVVFFNNNGSSTGSANTYTAPSGWTQLDVDTAHSYSTYEAFYHVVASGDGKTFSFTPSCACREQVWIAAEYAGVNASSPIDGHGFAFIPANTTAWTTPSKTPAQANDVAVVTMMPQTGALSWTNAAGWTTDIGPAATWSTELVHEGLSSTTAVSETSTISAASGYGGYAAIVLLAPNGSATPTPAPSPGQYSSVVMQDSPTAYYRLDDTGTTAADSSGNALNGAIGSGVTTSAPGLLTSSTDTAMLFHGTASTSGVVTVAQNALLQPASAVTLEAWLRFSTTPPLYAVPVAYGNDTDWAPYDFWFSYGGKLAAQWDLSTGHSYIISANALQPNTTYHVVSTFDGTNERLYINGALAASGTASGTLTNYLSGYGLTIGDDAGFSDPAFNGTVDEVAVYAGKALSASRVLAHYQAGTGSTPAPTPTPATYSDWSTFGDNLQRTGYNPNETALTQTNVANGMKIAWSHDLGGAVVAQPVLATNVSINGTPTNVLYVGAENNVFYALNADTGAVIWQNTSLGSPQQTGCGDLPGGTFGITGTATYDKSAGVVYVADGNDYVHALSMTTGAEQWRTSVLYDPNTGTTVGAPAQDHVYGGLALNAALGVLYAYTGSICDTAPWHGRIVAINTSTHAVTAAFFPGRTGSGKTGTAYCGGGVWGMGGASIDPNTNDVFIATGNNVTSTIGGCLSDANGETYPYGDSVIELDSNLNLLSYQVATINGSKASNDSDYGATPMLYSTGCSAEQASTKNKDGYVYTYGENTSLNFEQQIQLAPKTSTGQFIGVPAFDPTTGMVYVGNPSQTGNYAHGLNAFNTNGCSGLTLSWKASIGSANATADDNQAPTVADGIVFFTDGIDDQLWAFNSVNGTVLWHSGTLIGSPCTSYSSPCGVYGAPMVDTRVYVGSFNHVLYAFST